MRKVTIVVPVLMTSCQVSEKPKSGPVKAHKIMAETAVAKAAGWPAARAVHLANRVNHDLDFVALIAFISFALPTENRPHLNRGGVRFDLRFVINAGVSIQDSEVRMKKVVAFLLNSES